MSATNEQLVQAMARKITKRFADIKPEREDARFDKKEIILPCRNTRSIRIQMHLPKSGHPKAAVQFSYDFITAHAIRLSLTSLASQVLAIGYENDTLAGLTSEELKNQGFIPENGTSLCAVSNMLTPDNYRLVHTGRKLFGPEYDEGHDNQPYYGPRVRDVFLRENLTIFDKTVAYRDVKIGTQTVNAYVGD